MTPNCTTRETSYAPPHGLVELGDGGFRRRRRQLPGFAVTVLTGSLYRRSTLCGKSIRSQRETPVGRVEMMIPSKRSPRLTTESIALSGSSSPISPPASWLGPDPPDELFEA